MSDSTPTPTTPAAPAAADSPTLPLSDAQTGTSTPDAEQPLAEQHQHWQIIPPALKEQDPEAYQKLRVAAMLDLLRFEAGNLPQTTRHALKQRYVNLNTYLSNTRNSLRAGMMKSMQRVFDHWVDNLGAISWNVLDILYAANDQRVVLHLLHLYQAGHFTLPGLSKPLHECCFEEVVEAEQTEEKQYWQEQQRQGSFIALTREQVLAPSGEKADDELTLGDFMLARKAIDQARLIAYEGRDGQRYILKDTTKETESTHQQAA